MFIYTEDGGYAYLDNASGGGRLTDKEVGSNFNYAGEDSGDFLASTQFLDMSVSPSLGWTSGAFFTPFYPDDSATHFVPHIKDCGEFLSPDYSINSLGPTTYEYPSLIGPASDGDLDSLFGSPAEPPGVTLYDTVEPTSPVCSSLI
jgi:hypothetical protein